MTNPHHPTPVISGRPNSGPRRSRRVIIGATVLGLGGIRTHLLVLYKLLRREGIETIIFATDSHWDDRTLSAARATGVRFHLPPPGLRPFRNWSAVYSALSWPLLMPRGANSLYCISAGASQLLLHRLKPRGTASINHEIVAPPGLHSPAGRCAAHLDATVANSTKVAEFMTGLWPHKPIRVIPFLTSDGPIPPPGNRRLLKPSDPLRVVYLGRLVAQKRPDQLVRRWPALSAQPGMAPARLDVYGYDPDGAMLSGLKAFVADSGLSGVVRIHGSYEVADLPRILQDSDLVVLPSLWEGLPLVLVEAMLRGVPFVATTAGGTQELGEGNPNVIITGTEWEDFEAGLLRMAIKLRAGEVDALQLHRWAEERYGYEAVSRQWLRCLLEPATFFGLNHGTGA